ncbi:AAA family ATPase [Flexivirga meconopsidis]|uniref:AAA family ATPase n=1 Tax=Flexivirga meconopsidis TaxID=2977121 RepID=UPI003134506D
MARDDVIPGHWLLTLAPVRQLIDAGLEFGQATVLVGENGSGKSTLIEAIAMAYGMNGEGGSTGATHSTWRSESPLHDWLRLVRGAGASRWGYFVRAETMHGRCSNSMTTASIRERGSNSTSSSTTADSVRHPNATCDTCAELSSRECAPSYP